MLIRVAFRYDDPRLFARLVTFVRGGDSAHCEAAWAWDGATHRCVSASFLDGGVRGKDIDLPASKWRVYEIEAAVDPRVWLAEHDDEEYDVWGLAGFFVRRITGERDKKFCSEAVAAMLGLPKPYLYDLLALESVVARYGRRVQ